MEFLELRAQLRARGGAAELWLVYMSDPFEEVQGGRMILCLQSAFWTRGEAYSFAEGRRQTQRWQQLYVFQLTASAVWAEGTAAGAAKFEMAFGRTRPLPAVSVTPTDLVAALSA
jgi:hypothetical protein